MICCSNISLALLFVGLAASGDRDRIDMNAIQGSWQALLSEHEGERDSPEVLKYVQWTFDNGKLTINEPRILANLDLGTVSVLGRARPKTATYRLDPTKIPKRIDITYLGLTTKAIYCLEGDTLKICGQESGVDRPTSFSTKPESGLHLIILKRLKPPRSR